MSNASDFVIENGVLKKYAGPGGDVVIPDGVTKIADWAFVNQRSVSAVVFPAGLTEIGNNAFLDCKGLTEVALPEGVTAVGVKAFAGCDGLRRITLPASLKTVGLRALDSPGIEEVTLAAGQIGKDWFGPALPPALGAKIEALAEQMSDPAFRQYALQPALWNGSSVEARAEMILSRQSKPVRAVLVDLILKKDAEPIAAAMAARPPFSKKESAAAAWFLTTFGASVREETANAIRGKLTGTPAETACVAAAEAPRYSPVGDALMSLPVREEKTAKEFIRSCGDRLKEYYAMSLSELPALTGADGAAVEPFVLAWLLCCHERMIRSYVTVAYKTPGVCKDAKAVLEHIDPASFRTALAGLCGLIAGHGPSKKMFLTYPLCRYLDEEGMWGLIRRVPTWAGRYSNEDSPPVETFRNAVLYSETVAALAYAEDHQLTKVYAETRGVDIETARDAIADLLTRETDPDAARDLFDRIRNLRTYALKKLFLLGYSRPADKWRKMYLETPVFRAAAENVIWSQGDRSFILTGEEMLDSAGAPCVLGPEPVTVAHPMDMKNEEIAAWQKLIKQRRIEPSFDQMNEPVIPMDNIAPDRYAGEEIPFSVLADLDESVIHVSYRNERGTSVSFRFDDCSARVRKAHWEEEFPRPVSGEELFRIESFRVKKISRRSNRVLVTLDRIILDSRVPKDDISVAALFPGLSEQDVKRYLKLASGSGASRVTAALLDYQHRAFPREGGDEDELL